MTIPRIEGFDITTWVRETSTGVIWRARQRSLDRPVLLHILKAGVEPSLRDAFERNARLVARIDAPGLVGVHDVSTTPDGLPFAILDAFEGQSLRDTLAATGPFNQRKLIPIARSIAETLRVAWEGHRYVHRNLKPEELFLLRDGSVRITDFVSAACVGPDGLLDDRSGEVVGTPAYMPPEQAEARPTLDTHADMYALGAILYLLATSHTPFEEYAADPIRLLQILPFGTLPSPRDSNTSITPGFEAVLNRLLMKNPQDRYGSWGGLIQDLDAIAAGKPPAIAKAFVASGKPTLAPSVRYPESVAEEPAAAPGGSELASLKRQRASSDPAYAPVLWLVLAAGLCALAYWRWNNPGMSLQELGDTVSAKIEEAKAELQSDEKAAPESPESAADLPRPLPAPPAAEPSDGAGDLPRPLPAPPASEPSAGVEAAPRPVQATPASPAQPPSWDADADDFDWTGDDETIDGGAGDIPRPVQAPTQQPAADPDAAFLGSVAAAIRAESSAQLLDVLKRWNATHPDEATAAAKTLNACGWPENRLGERMANFRGKKLSFTYRQQPVTILPSRYVDGKLTGDFVQKDGTTRSVTFPVADLDAKTKWSLYSECIPPPSVIEPESHAAAALYALAAGDLPGFRAEVPLTGGLESILRRLEKSLQARAGAAP